MQNTFLRLDAYFQIRTKDEKRFFLKYEVPTGLFIKLSFKPVDENEPMVVEGILAIKEPEDYMILAEPPLDLTYTPSMVAIPGGTFDAQLVTELGQIDLLGVMKITTWNVKIIQVYSLPGEVLIAVSIRLYNPTPQSPANGDMLFGHWLRHRSPSLELHQIL